MAKPDYGIDAPRVGLIIALAVVAGLVFGLEFRGSTSEAARTAASVILSLVPTGVILILLMVSYVKVEKFRHRDRMLNLVSWRGDEQVLDIGTGRGLLMIGAAKRLTTSKSIGIDIWREQDLSQNTLEAARRNALIEGVADKVELRNADARQMPFLDRSFDCVLSNLCLHNIPIQEGRAAACREIARVLKPGGVALVSDFKYTDEYAKAFREAGPGNQSLRLASSGADAPENRQGYETMKLTLALLGCCAALCAASGPDDRRVTDPRSITSAANPNAAAAPIEELVYTRSTGGPAWSPDGREIVFTTNLTGRTNFWKVAAAGGWPIQLTQSDDRQSAADWSPDGKWIVYQQDYAGGRVFDLFAIPAAGGPPVNLTRTPDIAEQSPYWSPDGRTLAISIKPKTSPIVDIALLDWRTHEVHNLSHETSKNHAWWFAGWSPDGQSLYANRGNAGGTDCDVYRIGLKSGELENLTPHTGDTGYKATSISADGRTLLINSNQKGGYFNVALLDIATRKLTWVTDTQWEALAGDFAPQGGRFTYIINADGRTTTYLGERGSSRSEPLSFPEGVTSPTGNPRAFSPSGDRLLISHGSSNRPADLWVYDLASRRATQLTYSALAGLQPANLPVARLVHYRSFDGKVISAFIWVPFNLQRDGAAPGMVLPHGGPAGQTLDSFNRTAEALASRGYVCIAPNVRGSRGYGMAFQRANYQDLGGGDLQDEVYAAKFLGATGYVNEKKIGIQGGSYGGYMAMMAIGKTPDVWAAAVELYGITDWLSEQAHESPEYQQYDQSILGDPVKDRKVYEDASPIKYFQNAKAPLLVLQGENDVIDPKEEADQVVDTLRKYGKTVDAHYYPGEGHGFAKRENQVDSLQRTIAWFDKYLKDARE